MFKVKITRERCKGCGLCIKFCRSGLVVLDKKLNRRGVQPAEFDGDSNGCTGCGNCAAMCPEAAIEIEEVPDEPAAAPTTRSDSEE